MSRALELPLAHLRKHLQPPEVLSALVLRIFLSCGLDFLSSLLADQGRQYQNHPAPRAGCLAAPSASHPSCSGPSSLRHFASRSPGFTSSSGRLAFGPSGWELPSPSPAFCSPSGRASTSAQLEPLSHH